MKAATSLVVMCFLGLIEASQIHQKTTFVGMDDEDQLNGMENPIPTEAYNNFVGKEIKEATNLQAVREDSIVPQSLVQELPADI